MSRLAVPLILALAAAQLGCGAEPIDISGPWSGAHNLIVTGSETASGSEGVVVNQSGRDVSFNFGGCDVEATQADGDTFEVHDFACTRLVNQKTWTLAGDGSSAITAGPGTFNMALAGDAESGAERSRFTWTFYGAR